MSSLYLVSSGNRRKDMAKLKCFIRLEWGDLDAENPRPSLTFRC